MVSSRCFCHSSYKVLIWNMFLRMMRIRNQNMVLKTTIILDIYMSLLESYGILHCLSAIGEVCPLWHVLKTIEDAISPCFSVSATLRCMLVGVSWELQSIHLKIAEIEKP